MNRLERLYERRSFGIRPGLERERAILEQLGNPQDAYATIHVAGTNGKGSVCTILESILLSAGLRVGLYTSPHLVRFNERIHVGGRPVDDKELAEVLEIVDEKEKEATFFECATAIGFETFRRNNVQIAIIEAGMGGRLDATNVVKPVVTAITCISLEHTEYLGPDIASIATEKAGIIKEGCPLVTGVLGEEAQMVVDKIAAEKGVVHVRASEAVSVAVLASGWAGQKVNVSTEIAEYGTMSFPLAGEHQTQNLAVAIGVVELLRSVAGYEIDETHVREGVAGASWPGRCQTLSVDPLVIVDGAHNSGGGRALAGALRKLSKGKSVGMIIGMCDDKDVYS
ncbi:MAG: bifunctional folylpolyglutamate synthase/dihydrofolate synthase, partial [Kiritimatiellae bacterium]|nr:bifunctional folylpolyglutamate synthase/dihydrofolate synthase [Kiritimatiellia bacterium]